MANNEYLSSLGADYLKTNQSFSGDTMYVQDYLGYTQNTDNPATTPATNNGLVSHQFMMDISPEYRQQVLLQMSASTPATVAPQNGLGYIAP